MLCVLYSLAWAIFGPFIACLPRQRGVALLQAVVTRNEVLPDYEIIMRIVCIELRSSPALSSHCDWVNVSAIYSLCTQQGFILFTFKQAIGHVTDLKLRDECSSL